MAIYVSGSLAFDRIMTFGGNLQDHVLMDKLHMLSVSFMVDSMDERRGGCAGNIAYTLALLGEKPIVVSAAGRDFTGYAAAWEKLGLSLEGIRRDSDVFTALCYITTDQNNNQITGFYPGAMSQPATYTFPNLDPAKDWAIVSPGSVDDMRRLPGFFREKGVRYIFDPGQQLPVLSGDDLCDAIRGSYACVTNDYELGMVCKKTGKSEEELVAMTGWLVTTLGVASPSAHGQEMTRTLTAALSANSRSPPIQYQTRPVTRAIVITTGTKTPLTLSASLATGAFEAVASSTSLMMPASTVSSPRPGGP